MHHAHELLEAIKPDSPDYGKVLKAVKFDLGDCAAFEAMADLSTKSFWRAPFPVCLFQTNEGPNLHMYLTTQSDELLTIRCFYKNEGTGFKWDQVNFDFEISPDAEHARFMNHTGTKDITDWVFETPGAANFGNNYVDLAKSLEVFSCCNVSQVEHSGPTFINRKRLQKNKPPIFAFRTLHITGEPAERGEQGAGDRATPRLHLRRGHIRRLADGRKVWVRSAVVGSKASGFIAKEYAVAMERAA